MIGSSNLFRSITALTALLFLLTSAASRAADPFTINAILSLTGYAGFIGQNSLVALRAAEDEANHAGGIEGRPVHFEVADDQSNPVVALQLANQLIASGTSAIVGPVLTSNCEAVFPQTLQNGPVTYCLSPALYPKANSYAFSGGPSTRDMNVAAVRYFRAKGWKRIALFTTTDASGQDGERQGLYALGLPENKSLQLVANEHMGVADVSIAGEAARLKAAHPDAILAWLTGTPTGTALRGFKDAGLDVPVMLNAGDIVQKQIQSYASFVPSTLLFPGFIFMAPDKTKDQRVHREQLQFVTALAALQAQPSAPAALVYDPARIIIAAYRHYGVKATAAQIKDYVEHVKDQPGIDGILNYTDGSQRGVGVSGVILVRWDDAKSDFVPASQPGGLP